MDKYLTTLNDDDFTLFEQIESLRSEIMQANISVEVLDYGAGNPEESRTQAQMHSGVVKHTTTKELCKIGLKNEFAHLLYALIKQKKPSSVLELGTCCGFSSLYMAQALRDDATIHTIEGSPQTAQIAQKNFLKAKSSNIKLHIGRFSDILPKLLPTIQPIEFAFIDGHHNKDATLNYFESIKPYLSDDALVIFDDISWSEGMREAWEIIKKDESVERFEDYHKLGLCFMGLQR